MYKVILSFRYLFKKRISYLAFLAVALCVFIVVIVMTVMRGLVADFRQKNHDFVGDCVVGTESLVGFAYYEEFIRMLEPADFVEGVSPVIKSYGLITPEVSERSIGVEIMGVEPVKHSKATGFGETLHYHKDDVSRAFECGHDSNLPGCVVGIDLWLARDANGSYSYGTGAAEMALAVSCFPLTSTGALANIGAGMVDTKTFCYRDTSHSGLGRVDGSTVYLPFEQAQLLCGMGGPDRRASWLHIRFKANEELRAGCEKVASLWQKFAQEKEGSRLSNLLENVTVQSWKDYRREFIAAMEKEETMLIALFSLVGVTTVFVVFVVLYMIVSHKSKDIGILKAVGVSNANVVRLYLEFAFLVGIFGSFVGLFGGWLFLLKINRIEGWLFKRFGFQLWDRTIYAIGDIPNRMDFGVLVAIILSAVAACLVGAFVPSWQAARLKPVESLQVSQL